VVDIRLCPPGLLGTEKVFASFAKRMANAEHFGTLCDNGIRCSMGGTIRRENADGIRERQVWNTNATVRSWRVSGLWMEGFRSSLHCHLWPRYA
jgi:hypothetical protein